MPQLLPHIKLFIDIEARSPGSTLTYLIKMKEGSHSWGAYQIIHDYLDARSRVEMAMSCKDLLHFYKRYQHF